MKITTLKTLGAIAIGYILFSSFKNKKLTGSVKAYDYQSNTPTNVLQGFSKVGTQVFDNNFAIIYTYDTAGLGMAITGTKGVEMYSVVIGKDFANGIPGFVLKTDIETI